jgi:hypothetical protein
MPTRVLSIAPAALAVYLILVGLGTDSTKYGPAANCAFDPVLEIATVIVFPGINPCAVVNVTSMVLIAANEIPVLADAISDVVGSLIVKALIKVLVGAVTAVPATVIDCIAPPALIVDT